MIEMIWIFCQIVGILTVGFTVWAMVIGQTQTLFSKRFSFAGFCLEIDSVKKQEMTFKFKKS